MEIYIALGRHSDTKQWKNEKVEWDWLADRCSKTFYTSETVKTYEQLVKKDRDRADKIKSLEGAFVGGYLSGGSRLKTNVLNRQVICLDADNADPKIWKRWKLFYGSSAFLYTTHQHKPDKWRIRLVILLDRPVEHDEYIAISRRITQTLGIEQFDKTTYDFNRYMYFPTTSSDGEFLYYRSKGKPLCADELLATYDDYRDVSEWPISEAEEQSARKLLKKAGDPLEKPFLIGAFNRVYDPITTAIDEFLYDVYARSETSEDRYTFIEGSTSNGLVIYGNLAYANQSTDPCNGRAVSAFDICRIHMFGELDKKVDPDTPVNRLPSQKAMEEFASEIEEVNAELVQTKLSATIEAFGLNVTGEAVDENEGGGSGVEDDGGRKKKGDPGWIKKLRGDSRGNITTSNMNIETILSNDPNLKGRFGLNLFSERLEIKGALPWNPDTDPRVWSKDDWHGLRVYLGKPPYDLKRTPMIEDVMSVVKHYNAFHPVRDYLQGTKWDGVERVESLLIDYLGAEDTPYVRAVTRKTLIAGVKRVFKPGCKFEYVLLLIGPEGRGKSELVRRLGGRWHSDTFSFSMLSGGNGIRAFEQMQGVWVMEIPEMSGLHKAEELDVKRFLGAQVDQYRPSHGEEKIVRPRQNIFIASSNVRKPLRPNDGNRRMWPVMTVVNEPEHDMWDELDEELIAQIWAEAYHYYKKKEPIFLSTEMEKTARKMQRSFEENDDWESIITDWLEEPLSDSFENAGEPRTEVSVSEIWEFALFGDKKNLNRSVSMRINAIMRNLPDWWETKNRPMKKGKPRQSQYIKKTETIVKMKRHKSDISLN